MKKIEKFLHQKKLHLKSKGMKVTKNGETLEKFHILDEKNQLTLHLMESKDGDSMYYVSEDGRGFTPLQGQRETIKRLEALLVE